MVKDQKYWLYKLSKLRIDRAHYGNPAPHKPLLLLVILEMAERGEIVEYGVQLSPDIAYRFSIFWSIVAHRRKQPPEVRLPFHHLGSDGFWQPITADGRVSSDKKLTTKIIIDESFFGYLSDQIFRDRARRVLIETEPYFMTEEKVALYSMFNIKPVVPEMQDNKEYYKINIQKGRDARFRIEVVVVAYKYTCALTGYRLTTTEMESIVEAAHIHEFHDSRNGIALSKNAHWQFDHGLWSLDDDYKVLVKKERFVESGGPEQRLVNFEGQKIILPINTAYWPKYEYLDWHRRRHGFLCQ
jgi:putative restriction endonuclease